MARDKEWDRALGASIKRHRELPPPGELKLTQRELGESAGFAPGKAAAVAISRIETGAVGVSPGRLIEIARILHTTPQELREEAEASLLAEVRDAAMASAKSADTGLSRVVRKTLGGRQAADNFRKRLMIEEEVAVRQEKTGRLLERLGDTKQEFLTKVLQPFIENASRIQWPDKRATGTVPESDIGVEDMQERYVQYNESLRHSVLDTVGTTAAGAGVGAAAGGGIAAILFASVAASATASTGTAIGTLSGAAATSATLAWLGGGSLAAGGLGVAGGALVLAGVVTLPALIAAGGVFAYQRSKKHKQAVEESGRIAEALEELDASAPVLRRVWTWLERESDVVSNLTTIGLRDIRWLVRYLDESEVHAYEDLEAAEQKRLDDLTALIVIGSSVLGLPVFRDLEPGASEDPDVDERREWIGLVLDHGEEFVDERLRPSRQKTKTT